MSVSSLSILFAAALLQAQPSPPPPHPPAATPDAADSVREDDRMVCRREAVLGSNKRERVCYTVRQRRAMADTSREAISRAESRGGVQTPPSGI